jgi:recombinational DNA repair protein RecR
MNSETERKKLQEEIKTANSIGFERARATYELAQGAIVKDYKDKLATLTAALKEIRDKWADCHEDSEIPCREKCLRCDIDKALKQVGDVE